MKAVDFCLLHAEASHWVTWKEHPHNRSSRFRVDMALLSAQSKPSLASYNQRVR